jgi:NADH:ubiquinone oxidoreductase subunit 6 (subunit J)
VILATVVDWDALWQVVLYSFVGAVGVSTVFSFGIVGLVRFDDARRGVRSGSGIGWAVLAALCGLIVTAAVVEAIVVMTSK